jgi:hypothetical protein
MARSLGKAHVDLENMHSGSSYMARTRIPISSGPVAKRLILYRRLSEIMALF